MHYDPSQPARAVWIEIIHTSQVGGVVMRHSLRGLCGLKFPSSSGNGMLAGHSLRGLCGLKCGTFGAGPNLNMSQPARAVWIEIGYISRYSPLACRSQPARAVWIIPMSL